MIETERLVLRSWRDDDRDLLDRHCNTPEVMLWLGGVQSREVVDHVVGLFVQWEKERGHTFWVVERRSDHAFLGFCGLKIADSANSTVPGEIEIGWRLRQDAWGQGYAREAASACLAFAFERLAARRVVAITVPQNEASWGLMRRLEMTHRPDLDYDDPLFPDLKPAIVHELSVEKWAR